MLNYLWAGMILVGIIFAACTGRMPDVTNAAIDSSKEAITLCITMMGVMSFWVGLMESGDHKECVQEDASHCPLSLSAPSSGPSGGGTYHDEYDRQYTGTWMGGHSGGTEGDGRVGGA